MVDTPGLDSGDRKVVEVRVLSGVPNKALKTYMVMYRFRKAGNFVQVEVRAPNNASETFKDDACFCTAENAVRFRAEAPNLIGLVCELVH